MSEKDPYRVFVTHLFREDEDYGRVFEYLQSRDNFYFLACSDPDKVPAAGGTEALKEELRNQIKAAEVVIMPVATYDQNNELMRFQVDAAKANKIPVVGVKSFGETISINKEMIDACDDIIDWNDRAIIEAIKRHGRNEDTAQWEVIEFDLD